MHNVSTKCLVRCKYILKHTRNWTWSDACSVCACMWTSKVISSFPCSIEQFLVPGETKPRAENEWYTSSFEPVQFLCKNKPPPPGFHTWPGYRRNKPHAHLPGVLLFPARASTTKTSVTDSHRQGHRSKPNPMLGSQPRKHQD